MRAGAKVLVLLPLIAVILTSGCTLFPDGTTGESNVVTINSLTAIPETVQAGQTVKIVAFIQNKGSERVPQTTLSGDETKSITAHLYNYCPGLFSLKQGVQESHTLTSLSINELKQVEWELEQSPETQVEVDCDMQMSVEYPYRTTGLTTIYLIESIELQRQIAEGTYQSKTSETSKGDGPVKAWFEVVGEQPISVVRKHPGSVTLALHVENTGSGTLVNNSVRIMDIKLAELGGTDQISIIDTDCEIINEYDGTKIGDTDEVKGELSLIQGEYQKICSAEIKGGDDSITDFPKESMVHATVTIEYEYEVIGEVEVTAKPEAA